MDFFRETFRIKSNPYLRPLYDALYDVLGRDASLRLKEKEAIEVVPLAYMRGRTLDNSFIILDEAQNTTREQMKMFLTRMGFGSKVVVTGDVTQIESSKREKIRPCGSVQSPERRGGHRLLLSEGYRRGEARTGEKDHKRLRQIL